MPEQNRVTPDGDVVAVPLRCAWLGNRGVVHGGTSGREIVRSHTTTAWITCALSYRGWVAPVWEPGRWTALFFHDEAVALAAGHRPCALCRRAAFVAYRDAVRDALGDARLRAPDLDRRLHTERRDRATRRPRRHALPWADLPDGTFVAVHVDPHDGTCVAVEVGPPDGTSVAVEVDPPDGTSVAEEDVPHLVVGDLLVPWSTAGYGVAVLQRPRAGEAAVLTPPTSVAAIAAGYLPQLDPGVSRAVTRSRAGVGSGSAQGVTH